MKWGDPGLELYNRVYSSFLGEDTKTAFCRPEQNNPTAINELQYTLTVKTGKMSLNNYVGT